MPTPAGTPVFTRKPIRWWFRTPWHGLAMVGGLMVVLVLYFLSKPPSPSPLIGSYIDLLQLKSRWAVGDILEAGGYSFWLSLTFMILLTTWLFFFYVFARGSYLQPDEQRPFLNVRLFAWPDNWREQVPSRRWIVAIFAAMLFFNVGLFAYYSQVLNENVAVEKLTGFYWFYGLAIVSRLLGVFIGVGILIQYALNDFWPAVRDFLRKYLVYFYPSIISLIIVAVVFRNMDQFDSLFIALVQSPGNFIVFAILFFPASLALIWFTPYYLFFTDYNHGDNQESWDSTRQVVDPPDKPRSRLRLYRWLALHKRLIVSQAAKEMPQDRVPAGFLNHREPNRIGYPSETFHRVRTLLGLGYIFTLVSICLNIYVGNQREPGYAATYILLGVGACVLLYWIVALRQLQLARRAGAKALPPTGGNHYPVRRWLPRWFYTIQDNFPSKTRSYYFVKKDWRYYLGSAALLLFSIFFMFVAVTGSDGINWQDHFLYFLIFLVASLFWFVWVAVYRRFYGEFTFAEERRIIAPSQNADTSPHSGNPPTQPSVPPLTDVFMDRLDHMSVQVMLFFNPFLALLALLFFLTGLLWPAFMTEVVPAINPLNIYLLLVNGLIGLFILIDRFLLLWEQDKQYEFFRHPENRDKEYGRLATHNFFWGAALVTALLLVNYLGNSYHEIDYNSTTYERDDAVDLLEYTRRYLDRYDPDKPIIFVAADGGGLKACYWTMLNLQRLDSLQLYRNVFMLSGASGGNIGLAMYTYLKARKLTAAQTSEPIEEIGAANFLSGDFTGLLTRFPLNYFPDLPGYSPARWEDRSEAMARAYLNIVGGDESDFSYEAIRRLPYAELWRRNDFRLPLFIANTTRAEDGMRGIVHPFPPQTEEIVELTAGLIDLSSSDGHSISFPDAAFLANRFPVMSPVGRIPGKGHFIDAGAADNSGISTIYHFLQYMKATAGKDSVAAAVYDEFFSAANRRVLISMRNDKTRFIRDQFYSQIGSLNRTVYQSEIVANANAAVNTGLSGVPNFWDDFLRSPVPKQLGLVDTFLTIDLPFRLRKYDVHTAFSGELSYEDMTQDIDRINNQIEKTLGCDAEDDCYIVAPPLGRLLAAPSRHYMRQMVEYPDNWGVGEWLR